MPAYVVVQITVEDPVRYAEYRRIAPPSIAAHGGRYIVRGGACEILEGSWPPGGAGVPDRRAGAGLVGLPRVRAGQGVAPAERQHRDAADRRLRGLALPSRADAFLDLCRPPSSTDIIGA